MKTRGKSDGTNSFYQASGINHPKYQKANTEKEDLITPILPVDHKYDAMDLIDPTIDSIKKAEQMCYHLHRVVREVCGEDAKIPPVVFDDSSYMSQATFTGANISIRPGFFANPDMVASPWIGEVRIEDFITTMLHEYQHFINQEFGVHQVFMNPNGKPNTVVTNEMVLEPVTETQRRKAEFTAQLENLDVNLLLANVPTRQTYYPSNLRRDEISAYQFQVWLHENGIVQLSDYGYLYYKERVEFFTKKLDHSLQYEKDNNYSSDGVKMK
jgi:hypothetical protein